MPDRILIVDDEEAMREIIIEWLGSNYEFLQAADGVQALTLLESNPVELMLSNMMMPNMDGIGLLERTKYKYPDMPVVMVTAVYDISVALAAIRDGAYDYVLKPFTAEQLRSTVSRALERRRLLIENRKYQETLESLVTLRNEQLRNTIEVLNYAIGIEQRQEIVGVLDRLVGDLSNGVVPGGKRFLQ